MTSMRMRLLFSLSFVHVCSCAGAVHRWGAGGGGGVGGDDVHANATFVVSFLCSRAGAVHWWGGGTFVFSFFFHLVLSLEGAVHM